MDNVLNMNCFKSSTVFLYFKTVGSPVSCAAGTKIFKSASGNSANIANSFWFIFHANIRARSADFCLFDSFAWIPSEAEEANTFLDKKKTKKIKNGIMPNIYNVKVNEKKFYFTPLRHFPRSLQLLGHWLVELVKGLEQSSRTKPLLQIQRPAAEHSPLPEQSFLHLTVAAVEEDPPDLEQSTPENPVRHSQTFKLWIIIS